MRVHILTGIAAILLILPGCADPSAPVKNSVTAAEVITEVFDPKIHEWPHSVSDLSPDPRLHFGRLENGLRYVIFPDGNPDGGVSLRLQFPAGHLQDPEGKEGLAHLLEHMAFRGSEKVDADDMVKQLEAVGLSSGRDTNAYTFADRTMYVFDFPERSHKSLDKGLFLFSEIAQNLRLSADLLETERDVVLAEGRLRDGASFRSAQAKLGFTFPHIKRWQSPIIGTDESLENISAEDLQTFYHQYYRPENALVLIAGQMPKDQTERLIKQYFKGWEADSVSVPDVQDTHSPFTESGTIYQDNNGSEVYLVENSDDAEKPDSQAMRKAKLSEEIAMNIFNTRLKDIADKTSKIGWMNAGLNVGPYGAVAFGAMGTGAYKTGVETWDQERRYILELGFDEDEIAQAYVERRHRLERVIAGKLHGPKIANFLAKNYQDGRTAQSARQNLRRLSALENELTALDYQAAFAKFFGDFQPRMRLEGKLVSDSILAKTQVALKDSREEPLAMRTASESVEFKIENLGPPGQVIESEPIRGTHIESVTYSNGVRMNYEATNIDPSRIVLNVSLRPDFSEVLPSLRRYENMLQSVRKSDIEGYSAADMRRLFVGKDVSFKGSISGQYINFNVETSRQDLEASLSVITAFLLNPDLTSKNWMEKYKRSQNTKRRHNNSSPLAYGRSKLEFYLTGANAKFMNLSVFVSMRQRKALEQLIERSAIEVGVAGDFEVNVLKDAIGRTLGALPNRPREFPERLKVAEDVVMTDAVEATKIYPGNDSQMALFYCWPISGSLSFEDRRWDQITTEILANKLTDHIRHDLGATYAAAKFWRHDAQIPNFAYLCGAVQIEPEREKDIRLVFRKVIRELGNGDVSRKEFNRAMQPKISQLTKANNKLSFRAYRAVNAAEYDLYAVKYFKSMRLGQLKPRLKAIFKDKDPRLIRVQAKENTVDLLLRTNRINAEMGDVEAMMFMAQQFKGKGFTEKNNEHVIYWYEKAEALGDTEASYQLGEVYAEQGSFHNIVTAAKKMTTAADAGHSQAQYRLSRMYRRNVSDFPNSSNEQIIDLLNRAALSGHKHAMGDLAYLYHQGAVVPRDYETAYVWALTAETFGNRKASLGYSGDDDLTYFSGKLDADAKHRAQERVNIWKVDFDAANPDFEIDLIP